MDEDWKDKAIQLWKLLDDIDTADDMCKDNEELYRNQVRQFHKKRWDVFNPKSGIDFCEKCDEFSDSYCMGCGFCSECCKPEGDGCGKENGGRE